MDLSLNILSAKIRDGNRDIKILREWSNKKGFTCSDERLIFSFRNIETSKLRNAFLSHTTKYGEGNVTYEGFCVIYGETSQKLIMEHYGLVYKPPKKNNVYDPRYISEREGISITEAETYISEYKKNKATSKKNFIEKYGYKLGTEKYEEFCNKTLKSGWYMEGTSKFGKEYYIRHGDSEETAINKAIAYNKQNSPVHIEYYTSRGYTLEFAILEIKKIHDKKAGRSLYDVYKNKYPELTSDEIDIKIKYNHNIYKNLSTEQEEEIANKIRETNERSGLWIPKDQLPKFEQYKREVLKYTYKNDITLLENYQHRGLAGTDGAYHLDHKYSIKQGFIDGILPSIIGSISNLEFITWEENVSKQHKCSILIGELIDNENQKNNKKH